MGNLATNFNLGNPFWLFTFRKPLKLFWGLPNGNSYRKKKKNTYNHAREKSEIVALPPPLPPWKYISITPLVSMLYMLVPISFDSHGWEVFLYMFTYSVGDSPLHSLGIPSFLAIFKNASCCYENKEGIINLITCFFDYACWALNSCVLSVSLLSPTTSSTEEMDTWC